MVKNKVCNDHLEEVFFSLGELKNKNKKKQKKKLNNLKDEDVLR